MTADEQHARAEYDARYKTGYMDSDGFAHWVRGDLGQQKVLDTLALIPLKPADVLDYGCGAGNWLATLKSRYPEANLAGVDISAVAIEKCRSRYPDARFAVFDGTTTPFPDGQFDVVFSYHVLEHVGSIEASIAEIGRLLHTGGYACIIFPCGNEGSLQDFVMRQLDGGIEPTDEGRFIHFFERQDGHLRRMQSPETIALFAANRMTLKGEYYAGQFWGAVDWLCRSCVPSYIRNFFGGKPPKDQVAKLRVSLIQRSFLAVNWLIRKKTLDTTAPRTLPKALAVRVVRRMGILLDWLILTLARREWNSRKHLRNGAAQYLVFEKT